MANSFTNSGLIIQVNGENSGTWGGYVDTNENITTLLIGGVSTQSITSGDVTPANADGTADAGKSLTFVCSGLLTGNRNLILPTKQRQFIVTNNCTGAFTLTAKTVAGTGIVVPQDGSLHLYCDGTNILKANDGTGLGLGTISTQNSNAVTITGGAITGTTFDSGSIGLTTPVNANAYGTVNVQTGTTYAPVLTDNGKTITMNNMSAQTITIPANASVAFPVGTSINLMSLGSGIVTIAITSDTLISKGSEVTLTGQYSVGNITKVATTTWLLSGDLT